MRPVVRFQHPRFVGLALLVAGVAMNAMNWHTITSEGRYSVIGTITGPIGTLWGLWRLCIGQPWDERTNRMQRWATVGDSVVLSVSLAVSALVVTWIFRHSDDESALVLALALGIGTIGGLVAGILEWRKQRGT